ncbi:class I SAM-dependent DNA methyltransferase [Roseovarius rhodophyticola]|uniref:Class I SAM-dependent methyltransferase n=1 Tax=Roseovarius rhodophyticola TaxID=3080827 RepID=A0ABZ2TE24_9RHOB|nr:class I SAM-dependent methyltransferase [Roseovarius sp. W115]MDV2928154.1 class I SAM-dependent methyltransferase [Roseovarius sp. W115]
MSDNKVLSSYKATSPKDKMATYDTWADSYERDLCAMGYRLPAITAGAFARYVAPDTGPILDAGCGGGIQAEALALMGYGPLIGLDLLNGMLEVARAKGIYSELHQGALGPQLDLSDNSMGAVLCIGTITPNHAPPDSLDGLIRVARPGAAIVFSLRDDPAQDPAYPDRVEALTNAGAWRAIWSSDSFGSMPYGAEEVTHRLHVYIKTAR